MLMVQIAPILFVSDLISHLDESCGPPRRNRSFSPTSFRASLNIRRAAHSPSFKPGEFTRKSHEADSAGSISTAAQQLRASLSDSASVLFGVHVTGRSLHWPASVKRRERNHGR